MTGRPREDQPREDLAATGRARQRQKEWFTGFRRRVLEDGEPYVIANAVAPHEIFHAMDVPVVSTPWYAAVIAAKRLSPHYFDLMDRLGYHDRLPRYTSLPFLTTLDDDPARAPYGGLPRPAMLLERLRGDSAQRVFEQWAKALGAPAFLLDATALTHLRPRWWDMGYDRWEDLYESHRLDFQVDQLEALIRFAEVTIGRPFRHAEFVRQMHAINAVGTLVAEARDLVARARPCPVSLPEQLTNVMAATWHRGSEWAIAHMRAYVDELRARVERGQGVCRDERVRLLWLNNGLWHDTGFYRAFEESHGAVFVWSMYTNFLADGYRKGFTDDPLRALAARHVSMNEQLHLPPWMADWIVHQARDFGAHGAVMLVPIGDRLSGFGTKLATAALERAGIPVLELRASMVDARGWDAPAMTRRVADFIETRITRD
jgi:benzoyl-CoA reductase subunit B